MILIRSLPIYRTESILHKLAHAEQIFVNVTYAKAYANGTASHSVDNQKNISATGYAKSVAVFIIFYI